jgi:hypothetical protein
MFNTDRPAAPGTGVGVLRNSIPSISSRFDAASVLTNSTFLPASASLSAAAVDNEVLPTPPLPVKNRCRVGRSRNPTRSGLSHACAASCETVLSHLLQLDPRTLTSMSITLSNALPCSK